MTNREVLRDQIAAILNDIFISREGRYKTTKELTDSILALPNLLVKAENQESPVYLILDIEEGTSITTVQYDMCSAGFVKVE